MCTFIIYCRNNQYLTETLHDLIDKTPPGLIQEIILCDDNGVLEKDKLPLNEWDHVIRTGNIGKSRAYNQAAALATSEILVFLQQPTKFSTDWLPPLLARLQARTLVCPVAFTLDTNLWATEDRGWQRYGLRWDFTVHNRKFRSSDNSPIACFCMVIRQDFFIEMGGFDDGSGPGPGDNICLSLKTWMAGGEVKIVDESYVAIVPEVESERRENLARLVEAWFPKYVSYYYQVSGQKPGNVGRIDRLVGFAEKCERSAEWWLANLQPELLGVQALHGTAHGKRVAVVGDGPSLGYVTHAMVNNHDIVIGVDYIGGLFDCDYVVSNSADVVAQLEVPVNRLVVPYVLEQKLSGGFVVAAEAVPGAIQLEVGEIGEVGGVFPPFCNFGNVTLLALHFALFLGPSTITLFGCDNKIIDGKSHTNLVEQYDTGEMWTDSEQTRKRFSFYETGLSQLGKLADNLNIPILRVGHV